MTIDEALAIVIDRAERWDIIVHEDGACEVQEGLGADRSLDYPECPEATELHEAVGVLRLWSLTGDDPADAQRKGA